ncbi:kinase-like protein [Rhizopogon vinicolor AM-OR11-026]|uniref:Kinase-like protein n=1 Tax=Rhizopogon vinicolor AM-OR11-026 TaxID=1314800 RepID=A0A1B7N6K4_9AGAM|nr:kinase-like protein [Rhizopogon vinicolor AM-OR11-026]
MVISPTQKPTHSFREDVKINDVSCRHIYTQFTTQTEPLTQFRLFHALSKNSNSSIYLCRKCDLKLYAMRISNKDSERLPTRTPHEYIQYQREIFREIRELQSFFLSPFIWSYEDGLEIRSIAEFYHHGSLQNLLDRDTNLSENLTLQLASEMVEALHTLHTAGIIHRDLAPCNIMFDVSGHIVITGFSQACRSHSTVSFPLHDTGSYCAPELILAWAHDFSVDCWSFGVLLYMMLFGSHPFVAKDENENVAITHANIIHSSLIIPNTKSISWAAQDLIINCLERNAALRLDIGQIKAHVYFGTM